MKTDTKISGSGKIGQGEYNLSRSAARRTHEAVTLKLSKVSGSCKVCPDATLEERCTSWFHSFSK